MIHIKTLRNITVITIISMSLLFGVHNAGLYHYSNGFDGAGHMEYINYIATNRQIPSPYGVETHQPPLYYIISAIVAVFTKNIRSVQYINISVFWLIILIAGLGLRKIFINDNQILIGMLSLIALPMLNIFLPTVTNELFNTFWVILCAVLGIYIYYAQKKSDQTKFFILLLISLVFGVWTKISIFMILPSILLIIFNSKMNTKKIIIYSFITITTFILAYLPIFYRASNTGSPSNIVQSVSMLKKYDKRPLNFYYRLDWIPKIDMYNTQYYSLLGGAWNSFWTDGQNVITPFVAFHKKSLILWLLGFILFPISLYGLWAHYKVDKKMTLVMTFIGASMLIFYLLYNIAGDHYSSVRLTYEMGIVLPYAFGISSAAKNKKIAILLTFLLLIQFITLFSFFWIEPWWFVTSPKNI